MEDIRKMPKNVEVILSLFNSERMEKQPVVLNWIIYLKEINAIIQEVDEVGEDINEKIDTLLMLCPHAYLLLKQDYKNAERFIKFVRHNYALEQILLEDLVNDESIDFLIDNAGFKRLDKTLKLNTNILKAALKKNKVHLMENDEVLAKVLENVEDYTLFLTNFMSLQKGLTGENSAFTWVEADFVSGSLALRFDEVLEKQHLEIFKNNESFNYFLKNYKGVVPKFIYQCMKQNSSFKKLSEKMKLNLKEKDIVDYAPFVREAYLNEILLEQEKTVTVKKVKNKI